MGRVARWADQRPVSGNGEIGPLQACEVGELAMTVNLTVENGDGNDEQAPEVTQSKSCRCFGFEECHPRLEAVRSRPASNELGHIGWCWGRVESRKRRGLFEAVGKERDATDAPPLKCPSLHVMGGAMLLACTSHLGLDRGLGFDEWLDWSRCSMNADLQFI